MNRIKLITQLGKFFGEKPELECKEIKERYKKMYQDACGVLGIIPKTAIAKRMIEGFDVTAGKTATLDYKINKKEVETEVVCKYSTDYLIKIFKVIKEMGDEISLKIRIKKDYPLSIETKHFIFILAPRVEEI